jgi:hydroxymethylpyrimidine/phosphomethylpyrimidine kinase
LNLSANTDVGKQKIDENDACRIQQASFLLFRRKVRNTKKVLSIAGSDCSGGAGIQADLKTFAAHGVYGMSVIVSVVAENTSRVIDVQDISPEMIEKQIDAVFEDIGTDAVKVGMLSQSACMEAVARKLREYRPRNIVIDPVMVAKNGCPLMQPDSMDTLIRKILPLADLLTPNIPEAERIAGIVINSAADMECAARQIAGLGVKNVLVKGGHAVGDALDILFDGKQFYRFRAERIDTKNTHGTGCTYSSAIASNLALGLDLEEAVKKAKDYVTTAIRHSLPIGKGCGPTHHFYDLYQNGLQKGAQSNEL